MSKKKKATIRQKAARRTAAGGFTEVIFNLSAGRNARGSLR